MKVAVVGSGPSGVAVSKGLISFGIKVDMLDFGNESDSRSDDLKEKIISKTMCDQDYAELNSKNDSGNILHNMKSIFNSLVGREVILEWEKKKRLGSDLTFRDTKEWLPVSGAPTARSLARGGLSNIWGATSYPLAESDYTDWPIEMIEMEPHYEAVVKMLSLQQKKDHLSQSYPIYGSESYSSKQTEVSKCLLKHWYNNQEELLSKDIIFGRSRIAVRMLDDENGLGCVRCGMCLTGCAYDSIYRANWTLNELLKYKGFRYLRPFWVQKFDDKGNYVRIYAKDPITGNEKSMDYDALFLAAGTLSTFRIVAESQNLYDIPVTIYDNDHYLVPFYRSTKCNEITDNPEFSLNELVIRTKTLGQPVHIQFYPMSQQIYDRFNDLIKINPKFAEGLTKNFLTKFMLAFLYLPGSSSAKMNAILKKSSPRSIISINQIKNPKSKIILRKSMLKLFNMRKALGLTPLLLTLPSSPKGPSGAHLSSSLPMSNNPGPLGTNKNGLVHGTRNIYAVDGSILPKLPAQNSTLTIMANAHRIAMEYGKIIGNG